jgi:hypothetical protein
VKAARIVLRAVALAAGCAAAPRPEQAPPAAARPGCARPTDEVREIVLDPAIHLQVAVLLTGAGPRGVAMFPQSDGDLCQSAAAPRQRPVNWSTALVKHPPCPVAVLVACASGVDGFAFRD